MSIRRYWQKLGPGLPVGLRAVLLCADAQYGRTIRVAGDPARITTAAREQIRLADPALPVFQIRTMEDLRQFSFWRFKLFGWMFSGFGAVALLLAAHAVVIGIVAALGVTQFIKTLLYNVTTSDPLNFSVVAVFLGVVVISASYVPARRAMGVDPIIALRND